MGRKDEMTDEAISQFIENYDSIVNEIIVSLDEGIGEGIKEGIKEGILEGLNESLNLGISYTREANEIKLKHIVQDISKGVLKDRVKNAAKEEICPVVKNKLENTCDAVINEIKERKITMSSDSIHLIGRIDIKKHARKKLKEIEEYIDKRKPHSFIHAVVFDGVQNTICDCFNECLKKCDIRIIRILNEVRQDYQI